ncbi:MAG: aminopeptidase P family protein, partial [Anaerolineae bacterium]|nr:aminopeptidase P family protein [Anaerolineae bacterium]
MELDRFKLERTCDALKKLDVDVALFSDFYNVSYLTGYTIFNENGPSPFTRGAASVIFAPQHVTLIAEGAAESVTEQGWTSVTEPYEGYNLRAPTAPPASYITAIVNAAGRILPQQGKVGVEMAYLPAAAWVKLQELRPNVTWIDLPPELLLLVRAVKSPNEIERLRACARLLEVGQEAMRQLVQEPGKSEIEVYSQCKAAMEAYLGERFALQDALHGGKNSAHVFPGMPTSYILQAGDLIISDIVPYYRGYWGDSCSTFVVGGASAITAEHRRIHQIARDAFMKGLDAMKPGVTGGQIDELVRGYIRQQGYEYPHHTGHGVGVSNHEEPRFIIGGQTVLEPGMVCAIEPGVYIEGYGGARQERMILITNDGAEMIAQNPF